MKRYACLFRNTAYNRPEEVARQMSDLGTGPSDSAGVRARAISNNDERAHRDFPFPARKRVEVFEIFVHDQVALGGVVDRDCKTNLENGRRMQRMLPTSFIMSQSIFSLVLGGRRIGRANGLHNIGVNGACPPPSWWTRSRDCLVCNRREEDTID